MVSGPPSPCEQSRGTETHTVCVSASPEAPLTLNFPKGNPISVSSPFPAVFPKGLSVPRMSVMSPRSSQLQFPPDSEVKA